MLPNDCGTFGSAHTALPLMVCGRASSFSFNFS
jgi:hypothetical protein